MTLRLSSSPHMLQFSSLIVCVLTLTFKLQVVQSFQLHPQQSSFSVSTLFPSTASRRNQAIKSTSTDENEEMAMKKKKREKVMSFLRKVGAVSKNKDYSTAMGVDEGPVGKNKSPVKVRLHVYLL